jgi:quercetin dioxygenase-like cupin family protein
MNLAIPAAIHHDHSIGTWFRTKASSSVRQPGQVTGMRPTIQAIAKDKILDIHQALGVTIECLEGSVWVTLDGSTRDVTLEAGQSFCVDRQQRTLIQALAAARIRLIHPPFSL